MIDCIEKEYHKNESEINAIVKNVKDGASQYEGEAYPNHFKVEDYFQRNSIYIKEIHEKKWDEMKRTVEAHLELIYEQIDSQHMEKDWYSKFEKIIDVYQKTMGGYWFEGKYFLSGKGCFICMDKDHRIEFDCHTLYRLFTQTKK